MDAPWTALAATLAAVNLAAFGQVGWDKRCAERGRRRVPESRLIAPVVLGGLPGVLFGMRRFRHKTIKRSFQAKLALATVLSLALWWGVWTLVTQGALQS
ncbi:MAG: DUF1294 domain-containing protein [Planctomycetota bacterium]|jgi:uncharacterized membrane protein YsdA (DUF1294 family)